MTLTNGEGIECPYCHEVHVDGEYLQGHVSYWGDDGDRKEFLCSTCDQTFSVSETVERSWESFPEVQATKRKTS